MATVQLESEAQNAAAVSLNNKTPNNMAYYSSHDWSGNVMGASYPTTVMPNSDASFFHVKGDKGSKGGVQYDGVDAANVPISLIIAWYAPADYDPSTSPNKVYVMCGPKSIVDPKPWDEVEKLLDNAASSASSYGVDATITHESGTATVVANIKFA